MFVFALAIFWLFPLGAAAQEDWSEPEVSRQSAGGRDDEARRRIKDLETKLQKIEAREAKRQEETDKKFRFDFSGKYKVRYNVRDNFNMNSAGQRWKFDNRGFADYRWQMKVESGWREWLVVALMDKGNFTFDWKEDGEGTLERWGEFLTVRYFLFRDLYFQYTGPVVLQLGRKNVTVGHDIVLEGPTDIARASFPFRSAGLGQATMSLGYMALAGGYNTYADFRKSGPPAGDRQQVFQADNRLNVALFTLEARPRPDRKFEFYAIKAFDNGDTGDADLNLDKDFDADTLRRDGQFEPLWLGASMDGRWNEIEWAVEGVLLRGSYSKGRNNDANAVFVSLRRPVKTARLKRLHAGLEYARGSGNKVTDAAAGNFKDFSGLFTCRDRKKFANIFTEDIRAGFFLWESNLANLTAYRAYAEAAVTDRFTLTPSAAFFRTTEDVYLGRGVVGDWSRGGATSTALTNEAGWELDLNAAFPILERLNGFVNLAYFRPGDVYRLPGGASAQSVHEAVLGMELVF